MTDQDCISDHSNHSWSPHAGLRPSSGPVQVVAAVHVAFHGVVRAACQFAWRHVNPAECRSSYLRQLPILIGNDKVSALRSSTPQCWHCVDLPLPVALHAIEVRRILSPVSRRVDVQVSMDVGG